MLDAGHGFLWIPNQTSQKDECCALVELLLDVRGDDSSLMAHFCRLGLLSADDTSIVPPPE